MPQYLLLLYHDRNGRRALSEAEMAPMVEKYMEWARMPFTVDTKRLGEDAGRVIRANGGKPAATDGPYSETKEVLGGYYLIEAKDYDDAVRLTMTHPHVQHGTVEIRQLYGQ